MSNARCQIVFSTFVLNFLPALLKHLAIPNETSSRIGSEFKILRQLKTICRTGFLTERAEHASRSVEDKFVENFFRRGLPATVISTSIAITSIQSSGHASAHKLQAMQSVSCVSGSMFSRGAP